MKNLTDSPSRTASSPWIARHASGATMIAFTAIAAAISYNDGLELVRHIGAAGRVAYLYPLLPDGLILISSISLYREAPERPAWAMAGVIIGVGLTLAMNVGAGLLHNWMYALADACVPVVFFVALEILRGSVKRGQGKPSAALAATVTAQPEPAEAASGPDEPLTPEAAFVALVDSGSRQEVADLIGISKSKVNRLYWRLTRTPDAGPEQAAPEADSADDEAAPEPPSIRYAEPVLNGSHA